ncbi:hypothetical protein VNI00_011365 [Paramarasmius palmivorus]|uniref:Uncharacterized protein n=1 Tax=Paramarasmius palmivorus TaxID=297713 RepID=A0AAW0CCE6_9AGAR
MPKGRGKGRTPATCRTLQSDEITRCTKLATHGKPYPNRCQHHHEQYCALTKAYKEASDIVNEILGPNDALPTRSEISQYNDYDATMEKARWVRQYVEAIREEIVGRKLHHRRFFLKNTLSVDSGHRLRLLNLEKQQRRTANLLDAIERRAADLYAEQHPENRPLTPWPHIEELNTENVLRVAEESMFAPSVRSQSDIEEVYQCRCQEGQIKTTDCMDAIQSADLSAEQHPENESLTPLPHIEELNTENDLRAVEESTLAPSVRSQSDIEEDWDTEEDIDLVGTKIRQQKERLLRVLNPSHNHDLFLRQEGEDIDPSVDIIRNTSRQYALRIILHEPILSVKAIGKASLEDLILSPDFSLEDAARFFILFELRFEVGLSWWKESLMEASAMGPDGDIGRFASIPGGRIRILDGWICNTHHTKSMNNEEWRLLLKSLQPIPKNVEHNFVRLCNDFKDLETFLSFAALGMIKSPSHLCNVDPELDCRSFWNTMSMSGVAVADSVTSSSSALAVPRKHPATRPGFCTWEEIESRSYIFGAVRNENHALTQRFLNELGCRPDLFYVVTRSETDPAGKLEVFGGLDDGYSFKALGQLQYRRYEAEASLSYPDGWVDRGEWQIGRSVVDILYGTDPKDLGYLTSPSHAAGYFFRDKQFPVKYFVVMDVQPHRHVSHVFKAVAWAALRAQGLAFGEYSELEYTRASNALYQRVEKERLS